MAGLNVYTSNRLEILVERLASVVREQPSSPLISEVIVVQSKGMERWLSLELARALGIWANCQYPFPNRFALEIFRTVVADVPAMEMLDTDADVWRIMRLLPQYLDRQGFEPIRTYLGESQLNLKRLQLSERIADLFDTYAVYRPELVLSWDAGKESHWQPELWRALFGEEASAHRARIWKLALTKLKKGDFTKDALPGRVSVFGIPVLPSYHFELLKGLAQYCDIHLFLLNPSREYWFDIFPERSIVSLQRATGRPVSLEALHLEEGNPILASSGKLGRDFFRAVAETESEPIGSFVEPEGRSLLAAVQSDILNLRNRGANSEKKVIESTDASFQVHVCHSAWREIEVLYDNLLNLFEVYPGLTPKDILVMAPNIETYSPYVSAVFDACQDERKRIPYSIADRHAPSESTIVDVFFRLLGLCKGRFEASEVLDLLDAPSVRKRFGLTDEDMEVVLRWVEGTRIRWGIDGGHRAELGLPPFEEASWNAGLERLLLGYALRGDGETLFGRRLPYEDVEGDQAKVLGRFLGFFRQLFRQIREMELPRPLEAWATTLETLVSTFIAQDEEDARDIQVLRGQIRSLKRLEGLAGFHDAIECEVVRYYLSRRLAREELSQGFLTGGVTFCEMLPMRSIPFRVVAVIGMNGDAFPREEQPVGFDLIAQDPQPGDRSLRDEDRYLFLEALLSARDVFYISYVGQSIRDNKEIPPSVLVSELLEYCEGGFATENGAPVVDLIVTKHRLQAFSPAYFSGDGPLFSYSEEDLEAARTRRSREQQSAPFITRPLAEPPAEWRSVSLADLKRFFQNPARYLLQQRLNIFLAQEEIALQGEEPFSLDALDQYDLGNLLIDKALAGADLKNYYDLARAKGVLPPGAPGELSYSDLVGRVNSFVKPLKPHVQHAPLDPIDVDVEIAGFKVTGRIDGIWPSGRLAFHFAGDKAKYRLALWVDHLMVNLVQQRGYPLMSRLLTEDESWTFGAVDAARDILEALLQTYWEGLCEPLRFFPESSLKFVERLNKGETRPDALLAALQAWRGNDYAAGEGTDPYLSLCFGRANPVADPFAELALRVFQPLLEHQERER
jgi:exodeoxyribonuclease V gamma subunit